MPIMRIHSPEICVAALAPLGAVDTIHALVGTGSKLETLTPGFTGDVTPGCFQADIFAALPDLERPRYMVHVADNGEEAIVQPYTHAGQPTDILEPAQAHSLPTTGIGEQFPVNAESGSVALGYTIGHFTYIGGLVIRMNEVQITRLAPLFSR